MAKTFSVPSSPSRSTLIVDKFLGADYTHDPGLVSMYQSPGCRNMVRDTPGKVRKAMGCEAEDSGLYSFSAIHHVLPITTSKGKYIEIGFCDDIAGGCIYKNTDKNIGWVSAYDYPLYGFRRGNKHHQLYFKGISTVMIDKDTILVFTGERIFGLRINENLSITPLFIDIFGKGSKTYVKPYYHLYGILTTYYYYPENSYELMEAKVPMVTMGGSTFDYIENEFVQKVTGVSYESVNMLSFAYREGYHVDTLVRGGRAVDKVQIASTENLVSPGTEFYENYTKYIVPKYNEHYYINGNDRINEFDYYSPQESQLRTYFDLNTGIVFTGASSAGLDEISGEDNYYVQYYVNNREQFEKLISCDLMFEYGLNGAKNRLFVSGNEEYRNYDWYSDYSNYTYFPDINYSVLGNASSSIVAYALLGNQLVTFKDEKEKNGNIILRSGSVDSNGNVTFNITGSVSGESAVNNKVIQYMDSEPIYLTKKGVYALTTDDIKGTNVGQCRSVYINGELLKHDLSNAISIMYNRYYVLFVEGYIFLLDESQPLSPSADEPYSTRQYAGFMIDYMSEFTIRSAFVDKDDTLHLGEDCSFYKVYKDSSDEESYKLRRKDSDGEYFDSSIHAIWDTPDFEGSAFYKNKTFRYLAVRLKSAIHTSIKIYVMKRGLWSFLKEDSTSYAYLVFSRLTFSRFSFSSDKTNKLGALKTRVKKIDKTRYKFENNNLNEPFGIMEYGIEYVQNGNYK